MLLGLFRKWDVFDQVMQAAFQYITKAFQNVNIKTLYFIVTVITELCTLHFCMERKLVHGNILSLHEFSKAYTDFTIFSTV